MLQSFPLQWNALLTTINTLDSIGLMDKFDFSNAKPCLSYHVSFQIELVHGEKTIGRTIIDEGTSTCVMYIPFWKALGSPELVPSNTLLTTFYGRYFHPHGIIPSFDIELVGKMVSVEVEVVDTPLDYNFILGRSCTYAMCAVLSSFF